MLFMHMQTHAHTHPGPRAPTHPPTHTLQIGYGRNGFRGVKCDKKTLVLCAYITMMTQCMNSHKYQAKLIFICKHTKIGKFPQQYYVI